MNLVYSQEQTLLRDSVESWVARRYSFDFRVRNSLQPTGWDRKVWQEMADMGWLGLTIPTADGGHGGTPVDVALLAESFGRALLLEPYVSTVLLGAGLIAAIGSTGQRAQHLPEIAAGRRVLAVAHAEPQSSLRFDRVAFFASRQGDTWVLQGEKSVVVDGPGADFFVVSARLSGSLEHTSGVGFFLVPAGVGGLHRSDYATVDGRRACRLDFQQVSVAQDAWLGTDADAWPAFEAVADRALAALAADSVGCMQALLQATLTHTKTRAQFGQPLAHNQVLRHRMARMAIACEEARSMALLAALKATAGPTERGRAVSAAHVKVAACARSVAEEAIQLHGAIGMTDELNVGAYLKRLMAHEVWLGTPAYHLRRCQTLAARAEDALA